MADDKPHNPFGEGSEPPPSPFAPPVPGSPPPPPPSPEAPGQWQPPTAWQPHQGHSSGQGTWPPAGPSQPSSGKSTASLILGILGIAFCPFICSVLALIFGYQARREIAASNGTIGGGGNATAGIVLGWIGTVLCILGIIFIIILAATGNLDDTTDEDPTFSDPGDFSVVGPVIAVAARALGLAA